MADLSTPISEIKTPEKKNNTKWLILFFVGVLLFIFILLNTNKPEVKTQEQQVQDVMEQVSKLIIIPDETPVVAAISDVETLKKEQAFYKDAEQGDILIIFPKSSKAIIYSRGKNIIVNAGPIQYNQ